MPYLAPILDARGRVTPEWQRWFRQIEIATTVISGNSTQGDANGTAVAQLESEVNTLAQQISQQAGVPPSRMIRTSLPLTGGGDLETDLTLAVQAATTNAMGVVRPDGATILVDSAGTIRAAALVIEVNGTPVGV